MSETEDQISPYLLGELDAGEAAEFERRIAADPRLREEVERLRPLVARLEGLPAEVWEAPQPPPLVLPEDAARPAPKRPEDAARPARRRRLRLPTLTLRPLPAAGLVVALLAVGVAGGLLIGGGGGSARPGAGATDLVLSRIDNGPAGAHGDVLVAGDRQRARVDVSGLDPSGYGRFYELWLLDEDGRMIGLGSFRVGADGRAEVEMPIPVTPSRYRYFDLSLQEDNGDPAHSGVSVLRRWRRSRRLAEAWRQGRTGYPIVDAGMRQLAREGFMHNRARMVVASFLTKTLYIDWRIGAEHFARLLVDADVASNAGNWQWVAGTGNDTRPNRVLNPLRQAARFDPEGAYVRRYLPELAGVPGGAVHEPWRLAAEERRELDYPAPVADHEEAAAEFKRRRSPG